MKNVQKEQRKSFDSNSTENNNIIPRSSTGSRFSNSANTERIPCKFCKRMFVEGRHKLHEDICQRINNKSGNDKEKPFSPTIKKSDNKNDELFKPSTDWRKKREELLCDLKSARLSSRGYNEPQPHSYSKAHPKTNELVQCLKCSMHLSVDKIAEHFTKACISKVDQNRTRQKRNNNDKKSMDQYDSDIDNDQLFLTNAFKIDLK